MVGEASTTTEEVNVWDIKISNKEEATTMVEEVVTMMETKWVVLINREVVLKP